MLTLPSRNVSSRRRQKSYGDHDKFLSRVTKTLCYGKYPKSDRTSLPVTELAAELFSRAKNKLSLDLLDVEEAALLSRRASVSPCSLVLALIYLDRLKASNPKYLSKIPPSQLFLISLMVGSKFMQDDGQEDEVNNCEWAVHAGMTVQDINRAEKEFLDAIQWEVYVSEKAFWRRLEAMERIIAHRQGCVRGWFSYTELDILLKTVQFASLIKTLINISVLCMASYTTSALAVIGSSMLVANLSPGLVSMATTRPPAESTSSPALPSLPISQESPLEDRFAMDSADIILPSSIGSHCATDRLFWNGTTECDDEPEVRQNWAAVLDMAWPQQHSTNTNYWTEVMQRYLVRDLVANSIVTVTF